MILFIVLFSARYHSSFCSYLNFTLAYNPYQPHTCFTFNFDEYYKQEFLDERGRQSLRPIGLNVIVLADGLPDDVEVDGYIPGLLRSFYSI